MKENFSTDLTNELTSKMTEKDENNLQETGYVCLTSLKPELPKDTITIPAKRDGKENFFHSAKTEIPSAISELPTEIGVNILSSIYYDGSTSIPNPQFIKDFIEENHDEQGKGICIYFRAAIYTLNFFSSEDPDKLHYQVAKETLEKDEKGLGSDEKARDLLARELVRECREFASKIIPKELLQENIDERKKYLFICTGEDENSSYLIFKKNEMLWIDHFFCEYLNKLGDRGKEFSGTIKKASQRWYEEYLDSKKSSDLFRLWVDPKCSPYQCRYIKVLAEVIWEDRLKKTYRRQSKQSPALAKPIIEMIKPMTSSMNKKVLIQQDDQVICKDKDGMVLFSAPTVDPIALKAFQGGINNMSSLTGHKVLRWQVKTGFQNWAQNKDDPRLIKICGGYSKIAELAACNSPKDIAKIKEILHMQAHGYFTFKDKSVGNMIALKIGESYKNGEPSKIEIVLGTILFPDYVHGLKPNERRLIPIGDLPPLHGSPNTHASQAQLQLLLLEEMSNQSNKIAERGYAIITLEKWKELAYEAGVSLDKIEYVINHWCQPDFISFLDRQGDEYRLVNGYEGSQNFLIQQGQHRNEQSKAGIEGTKERWKKNKKS